MDNYIFFPAGYSDALGYAVQELRQANCNIATAPGPAVTHLLLPVPSFAPDGSLKGGGCLKDILDALPKTVTVIGGNLEHPDLSGYRTIDLLQDSFYLAENAAITAYCAIQETTARLPVILRGCPVLIIGWGRIGKCLADLLKQMGADVCIAARKEADRAMMSALGYETAAIPVPGELLKDFRIIFNTVPLMVLPEASAQQCRPDCLKIDLASKPGIGGPDIVWARGLPGKDAPESSGALIAQTILGLKGALS